MVKVNYDLLNGEQKEQLSFYAKNAVNPGKNAAGYWLGMFAKVEPTNTKGFTDGKVFVKNLSANLDKLLTDLGLSFVEVQTLAAELKKEAKFKGLTQIELASVNELLNAKVTEYGQLETQYDTEVKAREAAEKAKADLTRVNSSLEIKLSETSTELEQTGSELELAEEANKELTGQYKSVEKAKVAAERKVACLKTRRDELKDDVKELKAQSREQTKEARRLYSEREDLATQVTAQTQVSAHYENTLRQVLVEYLGVPSGDLNVPAHMDVSQVLTDKLTAALQAQAQFRAELSEQAEAGLRELSVLSEEEVKVGKGKKN